MPRPLEDERPVVIVGAGPAGCACAEELRRNGYSGPISIIGEESVAPYDRPPLSKQVLAGAWEPERALLMPDRRSEELAARWLRGRRAVALDLQAQRIATDDGRVHEYAAAVVATGVAPRTIDDQGLSGVHVLRTGEHALRLRGELGRGRRLVVIGGGFLGLEAAATARAIGCEVAVVEPLLEPLADRLGAIVARRLASLHRDRGVRVLSGRLVTRLLADRTGRRVGGVALSDGTEIATDVVLVAIGASPRVEWLADSGLEIDDGVVCDRRCQAGPSVWAAGDVARWHHVIVGRSIRIEHRMNATEQGRGVARAILGERAPFAPLPFFWTDQYDARIQVWGIVPRDPVVEVVEGGAGEDAFVAELRSATSGDTWAVLGWNAARVLHPHRARLARAWTSDAKVGSHHG